MLKTLAASLNYSSPRDVIGSFVLVVAGQLSLLDVRGGSWCKTFSLQSSGNSFSLIINVGPKLFDSILLVETNLLPESSNNLLWVVINAIGNAFFFFFVLFFEETEYEKQIQAHIFHWSQIRDTNSWDFNVTLYSDVIKLNFWNQFLHNWPFQMNDMLLPCSTDSHFRWKD